MTARERREAIKAFGLPTRASKMPGACGPSLPPRACLIGSKLRRVPTSPCFKCYAARLGKAYPSANRRGEANLRVLRRALADAPKHYGNGLCHTPEGIRPASHEGRCKTCEWIRAGVALLREEAEVFQDNRVRWQVAGDLQSVEHARMIYDVCAQTPELLHRMPTMERGMVFELSKRGILPPGNLKVTISLPRVNTGILPGASLWPTSSVWTREFLATHTPAGYFVCPAVLEKHPCNECRACWPGSQSKPHVIYPQH